MYISKYDNGYGVSVGSLDSTEVTYSTKAQTGRPSLQDTPSSSSKRLPGRVSLSRTTASSQINNDKNND